MMGAKGSKGNRGGGIRPHYTPAHSPPDTAPLPRRSTPRYPPRMAQKSCVSDIPPTPPPGANARPVHCQPLSAGTPPVPTIASIAPGAKATFGKASHIRKNVRNIGTEGIRSWKRISQIGGMAARQLGLGYQTKGEQNGPLRSGPAPPARRSGKRFAQQLGT